MLQLKTRFLQMGNQTATCNEQYKSSETIQIYTEKGSDFHDVYTAGQTKQLMVESCKGLIAHMNLSGSFVAIVLFWYFG